MRSALVLGLTLGATAVNLAFWLGPTRRLRALLGKLEAKPESSAKPPAVSVIAAVRDEGHRVDALLDDLLAQRHPELEVVVCDDDSADDTGERLAARAARDARLRPLTLRPKRAPGKKAALTHCILAARHDWLLAIDADCRPASPTWATEMLAAAGPYDEVVLGYSPYLPSPTPSWLNRWIRFEAFYTAVQYLSAALAGRPYMGVGRNLLYGRGLFGAVGGFRDHAHLAGGDDDLLVSAAARRGRGVAVCVAPAAWTYSEAHGTWAAYRRQKRRHLSVAPAYRLADRLWLAALAVSHVGHYAGAAALVASGRGRTALLIYMVRGAAVWRRAAELAGGLGLADLRAYLPLADAATAAYYVFAAASLGRRGSATKAW